MPRYFFHIHDGVDIIDDEGTILADIAAARGQAIATAGAMLKDEGEKFWGGTEWRMIVADQSGETVCLLRFSAE